MSHDAPSCQYSAPTPTDVASSDPQLAALVDGRHYKARRHSIVHPTTIQLSPPSIVVDYDPVLAHSPVVRKILTLPADCHAPNYTNVSSSHNVTGNRGGQTPTSTNNPTGGLAFTAEDVQPFCNRDTMIYATYPGLSGTSSQKLWKEMYKIWYPHRGTAAIGETGALKGGAFFAKFAMLESGQDVAYSTHGGSSSVGGDDSKANDRGRGGRNGATEQKEGVLARFVKFHEQLCKVIKGIVGTGRGLRMKGVNSRESPVAQEREEWYGLKETFKDCFVFIEGEEWEREGVVVVWRGDRLSREMDERSGVDRAGDRVQEISPEEVSENPEAEGEKSKRGGWKYSKMALEDAMMKIMLAQDADRKERNVEGNAFWEKWFGRKIEKCSQQGADRESESEGKGIDP